MTDEARAHLDAVTNTMYTDLKVRLLRNIEIREKEDATTNAPGVKPDIKQEEKR